MKNEYIKQILVEKALDDIKKYRIEGKERGLETQVPRWIGLYMQSLQKTNKEVFEVVSEKLEEIGKNWEGK